MNRAHTLSIIIDSRWGEHHLPRMFQSLAWQTAELDRVEVIYLEEDGAKPSPTAAVWKNLLPCSFTSVAIKRDEPEGASFLRARKTATGDLLLTPHSSTRFTPYYIHDVLNEFDTRRELDVLSTDFVDLGQAAVGLVRLPRFARWRLKTRNIIGPQAVFRASSLDSLHGPRMDSPFTTWDLSVQAALAGMSFARLDRALYSCSLELHEPAYTIQAAAMVVVHNHGFFREDVVRWAMAATRRAPWAMAVTPNRIPAAREVRQLYRDHVAHQNDNTPRWLWAFTGPPPVLPATVQVRSSEAI